MPESIKAEDLVKELFDKILLDSTQFDQEVVQIMKKYLTSPTIHSKADEKISAELDQLVQERATTSKASNGE